MAIGSNIVIASGFDYYDGSTPIGGGGDCNASSSTVSIYNEDFYLGGITASDPIWFYWTDSSASGGAFGIGGKAGGNLVISSGGSGGGVGAIIFRQPTFDISQDPIMESVWHTSENGITSRTIKAGWYVDTNDYCYFYFNTDVDANNIYVAYKNNGGAETLVDTGVNIVDSVVHNYKIALSSDGSFIAYIDGVSVATGVASALRDVAFLPYYYITNNGVAQHVHIWLDWIKVSQTRV